MVSAKFTVIHTIGDKARLTVSADYPWVVATPSTVAGLASTRVVAFHKTAKSADASCATFNETGGV